MSHQARWRRLNNSLGFTQDERSRQVHLESIGVAYLALLAMTFVVATYLEFFTERSAVLFTVTALIGLSVLVLITRRARLGVLGGKQDERAERLRASAWRYAYLSLSFGIFLYASYRFWVLGDSLGLFAWNLCLIAGLLALITTQILKNTLLGHLWVWGIAVGLLGGLLSWNLNWLGPLVLQLIRSGEPVSLAMLWLTILLLSVVGIFATFTLGAWRSWQNQRGSHHGG